MAAGGKSLDAGVAGAAAVVAGPDGFEAACLLGGAWFCLDAQGGAAIVAGCGDAATLGVAGVAEGAFEVPTTMAHFMNGAAGDITATQPPGLITHQDGVALAAGTTTQRHGTLREEQLSLADLAHISAGSALGMARRVPPDGHKAEAFATHDETPGVCRKISDSIGLIAASEESHRELATDWAALLAALLDALV